MITLKSRALCLHTPICTEPIGIMIEFRLFFIQSRNLEWHLRKSDIFYGVCNWFSGRTYTGAASSWACTDKRLIIVWTGHRFPCPFYNTTSINCHQNDQIQRVQAVMPSASYQPHPGSHICLNHLTSSNYKPMPEQLA